MLELRTGPTLFTDHSHPHSHSLSPHPSNFFSQQQPTHTHGPPAQHYMSPTPRRPSAAAALAKQSSTPLTISPTLSTLSSLSSESQIGRAHV